MILLMRIATSRPKMVLLGWGAGTRTSLAVFTLSCGGWPRMGTRI
jgi:hypothetical protein